MPIPKLTGMPVLVTGGAGFIGSHLVDALLDRGARVRVLDDLSTGRLENLQSRISEIELVEDDIRLPEACHHACQGIRIVFHQAALGSVPRSLRDPSTTLAVNTLGTAHLLAAAREAGVEKVVYASSSSVYGDSAKLPKREGDEGNPMSPYAASKQMTEGLATLFERCYGLLAIGLRYFNVYGPRQDPEGPYAAVIPRFFRACLERRAPTIFGDGEQSRDFTFVGDAVLANLLAAGAPAGAWGRAYNVAAGRRTTVNQLAAAIAKLTGSPAAPEHRPARPGDVRHSLADLAGAGSLLRYQPETDLEQGLAACLDYYLVDRRDSASRTSEARNE